MTFPIKKRINTEHFIDGKQGALYTIGDIKKNNTDLLEEGKTKTAG